jgi:WD40 repeat protein
LRSNFLRVFCFDTAISFITALSLFYLKQYPSNRSNLTVTPSGSQVWDVRTGASITLLPFAQRNAVKRMEFSPDGARIATASEGFARLWDAVTGQPVTEPLRHPGIRAFLFSPDGQHLATCSKDGSLLLWDIRPGRALSLLFPHSDRVWRAHFSGDGNRLVTASWDHTAQIWDAHTGQAVGLPMRHADRVIGLSFSTDGLLVATADHGGFARIWDGLTGRPLSDSLQHAGDVRSARISPDGRLLVTASSDKTARVWHAHTGRPISSLPHERAVGGALFHPDSQRVITVASNIVQIWNARSGQRLTGPIKLDHYSTSGAQFSHDGHRFVTATDNGTAQIWDTTTGQPLAGPLKHRDRIWCAIFSPNDDVVATASLDHTACLWDSFTGRALTAPMQHNRRVNSIAFNSKGDRVVTATLDNMARVWDARTGQPLSEPLQEDAEVATAEFSLDGRWIATSSAGNTAHIWEVGLFPSPAPLWLADLAEAVAQQKFNPEGVAEGISICEFMKVRDELSKRKENDAYTQWVKWFFADRSARAISPNSEVTVPEYIRGRIQQDTLESLQEAIWLSSTNGLPMARLALPSRKPQYRMLVMQGRRTSIASAHLNSPLTIRK